MPTKSTTETPVKRREGRPSIPLVPRICEYCEQPFLTKHSYVVWGRCRFCSRACYLAARIDRRPLAEQFSEKVNKTDTCWLWTGRMNKVNGYGIFVIDGKKHPAHRVAWTLTHGPIPEGMLICHHCDVRLCVRDDHLFLGTYADNNIDKMNKGRCVTGEQHKHTYLTNDQVREMRRLYADGLRICEIARLFGISRGTIGSIVHRKVWKHIL